MAEFKHIIRIANTDLDGNKQILYAMKKIKGVDVMFANAALSIAGIKKTEKAGNLTDEDAEKIDAVLKDPLNNNIPTWMLNRRKDTDTGDDLHLMLGDLIFTLDNDLKKLKKIKSYRGLRHQWGLPVRGQKTKSNFRRNKGKGLGVKKKKK